jgi:hypothetical protein
MSVTVSDGPAIVAGYEYTLRIAADLPLFPLGCALTSHVRRKIGDTTIMATLKTENGGLVRVSDNEVDIVIPGTESLAWTAGSVVLDMVRTDLTPDKHLGFFLEIPVVLAVTRGL